MSSASTQSCASASGTVSIGRRCCVARPATICSACSRPMRVGYEGSAMRADVMDMFVIAEIFGCVEIMERLAHIVEIDDERTARDKPAHGRSVFAQRGLRGGMPDIRRRTDTIEREQRLALVGETC